MADTAYLGAKRRGFNHLYKKRLYEAYMLKQGLGNDVDVSVQTAHYDRSSHPAAAWDGAGILVTASTGGGCVLGAAVPARKGPPAEEIGAEAASQLLEDLAHGGCADRW